MPVKNSARVLATTLNVYLQALQIQELTGANVQKSLTIVKLANDHLKSFDKVKLRQIYYRGKALIDQLPIKLIPTNHAIPLSDQVLTEISLFTPEQIKSLGDKHKRKKTAHKAAS